MKYGRFYLAWIAGNLIGFMVGSVMGATSNGLVPALVPGFIGLVCGDLIFGLAIGLAQWRVLRSTNINVFLPGWLFASSIGFMLGARLGSLLTYRLVADWLPAHIVFGIFMGTCIGLATTLPLSRIIAWPKLIGWIVISIPAWVLGESIAFASEFAQAYVPVIAISISALTGLELLRLQRPKPVDL